jgi:hypothetical protein
MGEAIDQALKDFANHPFILQRFQKSKLFDAQYVDFEAERDTRAFSRAGSVCAPTTSWWTTTAKLGGILATDLSGQ